MDTRCLNCKACKILVQICCLASKVPRLIYKVYNSYFKVYNNSVARKELSLENSCLPLAHNMVVPILCNTSQ